MAVLTLHLYVPSRTANPRVHVRLVVQGYGPGIVGIAQRRELRMVVRKVADHGLEVRSAALQVKIAMALHTLLVRDIHGGIVAFVLSVAVRAFRGEGLRGLVLGRLVARQAIPVVDLRSE